MDDDLDVRVLGACRFHVRHLEALVHRAVALPQEERGLLYLALVEPTEVDDDGTALLSFEIAREIEDQLEYPGQVKVIVIRESRSVEVAK